MSEPGKIGAIVLLGVLLIVSLFLAFERQGLMPWLGVLLGVIGAALTVKLSGRAMLYYAVAVSALTMAGWMGSVYYVFSTWESGEVVDIEFNDDFAIRTWVVEEDGNEIVLYDCAPAFQALIEGSESVEVTRGDEQYRAGLTAVRADPGSAELNKVYGLYEEKYTTQSLATQVYYVVIGPKRGSQLYALYLNRNDV